MVKKIAKIEVIKNGSNPDVDSDFHTEHRERAIEHVQEIYGKDNVANIVTFGTLAAKGAFKELSTIYNKNFAQANKIASLVPPMIEGVDCKLADIYNPDSDRYGEGADFREAVSGEDWQKIVEGARNIEGRNKSTGVHACGIVMSNVPLSDAIPLHVRQKDQRVITQWTYPECESLGLIKMDFLGLDTVDLVQNSVSNIIKNGKTPPNMIDIIHGEMDDPAVYKLFQEGHTTGIFQFGSEMVRNLLLLTKPTEFNDLPAITSVARPGPMRMQSHVKYADRKNGREEIDYIHPEFKGTVMEEILGKTNGLVIYQEQVQQISNKIAGMTLQEGDDLRRAMGKKKQKVMDAMRPKFFEGAMANGFSEEAVTTLWETLEPFAKYGFNKCLYGRTLVSLPHGKGKISIENLYEKFINGEKDIEILSMFEDGEIRPHKVTNIVQTGVKPLYKIKTKNGRIIRLTKEHRLLTPGGYGTIEDGGLQVGKELIVDSEWTKRLSDQTRLTRQKTMSKINQTDEQREKARERMIAYQETLSFADRSAHQKQIQLNNPQRSEKSLQAMKARLEHLRTNDIEWQNQFLDSMQKSFEQHSGIRRGYGVPTTLSDGRIADSIAEAAAAEYLISRGIDFEMHKIFTSVHGTAKITDFYVNGLYFEMDGLRRGREYFVKEKYGNDIPFVYLTPANFGDEIDNALMSHHIENGDEIVEIIEPKILANGSILREMTYDIEMDTTGPANFIANGIVSHNSHAVAYAMNSYQSAYLKTHYPVEFMASLIAQHVDNKDKTLDHLREASRMGLKVSTVDINLSDTRVSPNYSKDKNLEIDIFFGLAGVKAVSTSMAEIIIEEREKNGDYASVKDVIDRCYPLGVRNKKIYENLALAGAFDSFEVSRKQVFINLPQLIDSVKTDESKGESLFDMFEVSDDSLEVDLTGEDYPFLDRLKKEAEMIGLYLTAHPTDKIGQLVNSEQYTKVNKLINSARTTTTTVIGSLLDIQVKRSKSGAKSMILNIDDGTGFLSANVAKPIVHGIDKTVAQDKIRKTYETGNGEVKTDLLTAATNTDIQNVQELEKYGLYVMNITFRPGRDDSPYGARVNWIRPLQLADDGSLPIRIRFKKTKNNAEKMEKLHKVLAPNLDKKVPGNSAIYTVIYTEEDLMKNNEALYMVAFDEIQKSENSETRVWPPKIPQSAKIEKQAMSNEDMIFAIENLSYQNSGYTTEKSQKVEQVIEKYVGYGAYDFGVFNPNSLDDN